jgi:DNA-binding MarR family transcriptional regulator
MAKQAKLTDLQLVLLSTASQRTDKNLLPVADSIKSDEGKVNKAIEALVKRGLAAEGDAGPKVPVWRQVGDRRIAVAITAEGKVAIGGEEPNKESGIASAPPPPPAPAATQRKPGEIRAGTKQALLVELLEREEGASIQQIVDATGWLPHTTRAALTGLKKRGFEISSEKVDGGSRYHAKRPA